MGLRRWLTKIERSAEQNMIVIEQQDGSVKYFPQEAFLQCLAHEWERGRQYRSGEPVTKGPHPLVVAIRRARFPERLRAEHLHTIEMLSFKEGDGVSGT
jgi:hypothetical protein